MEWTELASTASLGLEDVLENDALRRVAAEAKSAVAKRRAAAEQAARDHFDRVVLPKLYMAARPKYIIHILGARRKGRDKPQELKDRVPWSPRRISL